MNRSASRREPPAATTQVLSQSDLLAATRHRGCPGKCVSCWHRDCTRPSQEDRKTMRYSDEELRDKTVIGADGHVVGEVSALFVDPSSWTIDALRVKLRRETADR